jgi:co-chaperonin GroES (HSP10)
MKYQIKPVGQKLLVAPLPPTEETTDGGIVLSAVNNAELTKGTILAVSPPLEGIYKEGEVVLYFEKRALGVIQGDKVLHLIDGGDGLAQGDVLAILN